MRSYGPSSKRNSPLFSGRSIGDSKHVQIVNDQHNVRASRFSSPGDFIKNKYVYQTYVCHLIC